MNCVGNFSLYLIFIRGFTLKTPGMPHRIRPLILHHELRCNISMQHFAHFTLVFCLFSHRQHM